MAAVNVPFTAATADVDAWLFAPDDAGWPEARRASPLSPIVHPHVPVMTEAPIATAATVVLMRRHMSIFDTPKDSLSSESRHPSIGSPVIRLKARQVL
jgi:hypothetical protein